MKALRMASPIHRTPNQAQFLMGSLLQLRKPGIVLLPLGVGFDQQGINLLLRPHHYPVLIGDDQVAISDENPTDRDRAADYYRTPFV